MNEIELIFIILVFLNIFIQSQSSLDILSKVSSRKPLLLDLSYTNQISSNEIVESILCYVNNQQKITSEISPSQKIDLSACFLDDDRLLSILTKLTLSEETEGTNFKKFGDINLTLFRNRITPKGASSLFEFLIQQGLQRRIFLSESEMKSSPDSIIEEIEINECVSQKNSDISDIPSCCILNTLDLSFNNLGVCIGRTTKNTDSYIAEQKSFLSLCRNVIENKSGFTCPCVFKMDACGLGPANCRSIGKGIVDGASISLDRSKQNFGKKLQRLTSLYLSGNDSIGDTGTVALAAALKVAARIPDSDYHTKSNVDQGEVPNLPVLDYLDLSSCAVGDIGAEALSIALEENRGCVRSLNLSNNQISDNGASAIGRALQSRSNCGLDSINLDNNSDIGDEGAAFLVKAGARSLSLRSCSIGTEGVQALGRALVEDSISNDHDKSSRILTEIDISGNDLGIHRKTTGLLTKRASETTTSYFRKFKKVLKGARIDVSGVMGRVASSDESDDEEEEKLSMISDGSDFQDENETCGAKSFANSIIDFTETQDYQGGDIENVDVRANFNREKGLRYKIGMRMCNFDIGVVDALAAAIICMMKQFGVHMEIDLAMNFEIEDHDIILALKNDLENNDISLLTEMSERYLNERKEKKMARQKEQKELEGARFDTKIINDLDGADDNYSDSIDYDDSYSGYSDV